MRLLPVSLLFTLSSLVVADSAKQKLEVPEVPGELASSTESSGDKVDPTIFNGVQVPPLLELPGETFNDTIKEGWWIVKHHS
jgi:protein disulfide-isomerase